MNENLKENSNSVIDNTPEPRRHPYTLSNTPEETIRRMKALPERIAKLYEQLERLDADRKPGSR